MVRVYYGVFLPSSQKPWLPIAASERNKVRHNECLSNSLRMCILYTTQGQVFQNGALHQLCSEVGTHHFVIINDAANV